jgi:hypothetical protein
VEGISLDLLPLRTATMSNGLPGNSFEESAADLDDLAGGVGRAFA